MKFFTIGYEKRKIEDFVRVLNDDSIEILIDIRAVPHSRIKKYARKNLEKKLNEAGIEYMLIKELGSPEELRKKVKSDGDYEYFFERYNEFLDGRMEYVARLMELARTKRICLLCYEKDFNRCHRQAVANRMTELSNDLEIEHLF